MKLLGRILGEFLYFACGRNISDSWLEGGLWWVLRCAHKFFVTYHQGMESNSSLFRYGLASNEENVAEVMLHGI